MKIRLCSLGRVIIHVILLKTLQYFCKSDFQMRLLVFLYVVACKEEIIPYKTSILFSAVSTVLLATTISILYL